MFWPHKEYNLISFDFISGNPDTDGTGLLIYDAKIFALRMHVKYFSWFGKLKTEMHQSFYKFYEKNNGDGVWIKNAMWYSETGRVVVSPGLRITLNKEYDRISENFQKEKQKADLDQDIEEKRKLVEELNKRYWDNWWREGFIKN